MNTSRSFLPNVHLQTTATTVFSTIILMLLRTVNPVAVTVYSNPKFSDRTFILVVVAQQPYSGLDLLVEVSISHIHAPHCSNPLD